MNKPDFRISYRAARINCEMSLDEASRKLEISKNVLQNYESRRTEPSWTMHEKMAKLYEVPIENLKA